MGQEINTLNNAHHIKVTIIHTRNYMFLYQVFSET